MLQTYMVYDGKRYEQGTVFVLKHHDGIAFTERRIIFCDYDTVSKRYLLITPTCYNEDSCTSYPDTRFMNCLIRTDTPTTKERTILNDVILRRARRMGNVQKKTDDRYGLLLKLGLLILLALLPPVGVIVLLCIVFSDGTPSGFVGCLTPFLILVVIALISML